MRFKRYLTEKTFNISKDVKYVYEKGFKPLVDSLKDINQLSMKLFKTDKNKDFFIKVRENKNVPFNRIMGNELPSKEAQAASKLNPVEIYTGAFDSGNFYRSKEVRGILDDSKLSLIQLSINKQALVIALRKEIYMLPVDQVKSFLQEFVPARIKATIAHELSHWLNDTMHNFHITNLLKTAHELNNIEVLKLHKKDVNMTHFEIDAQIHGIKQLKMANKKKWDSRFSQGCL